MSTSTFNYSTPIQTPYYSLGSTAITISVEPVRSPLFSGCGDDIHKSIGSFLDRNDLEAYGKTSKYAYRIVLGNAIEEALAERIANSHHKKFIAGMNSMAVLIVLLGLANMIRNLAIINFTAYLENILSWRIHYSACRVTVILCRSFKTIGEFENYRKLLWFVAIILNFAPGGVTMGFRALRAEKFFEFTDHPLKEDYSHIPAYILFAHGTILCARTLISRKCIIKLYKPNLCQRISSSISACFRRCFS